MRDERYVSTSTMSVHWGLFGGSEVDISNIDQFSWRFMSIVVMDNYLVSEIKSCFRPFSEWCLFVATAGEIVRLTFSGVNHAFLDMTEMWT